MSSSHYLTQCIKLAQIIAGISEEVAKWITTAYKNIVGVGVDLPNVDAGNSAGQVTLKTLTSRRTVCMYWIT